MPESPQCTVSITPAVATAGQRGTWKLTFTLGPEGMRVGGALRIRPPQKGMVRWEVGKLTATASRPRAACEVSLFDCHPISYHWRHAPIVQVDLLGEELAEGDTITVIIGERGGYSRGYFVRARAQDHAHQQAEWDFWIDVEGNKSLQPERAIDDPWVQLDSILMDVAPDRPARLHVIACQPQSDEDEFMVLVAARDAYGNFCEQHQGALILIAGLQIYSGELSEGSVTPRFRCGEGDVIRATAVDPEHELTGTSNPVCRGFAGDRTICFGDLHVMTGEGIIASALEGTDYGYRWGRDVAGLDFCCITNNVSLWAEDLALDDEFHKPGQFVTIPACEIGFSIGHKNVYFPTTDADAPDPSSPESLFASLEGREALVIPHHTSVFSESSRRTFWTEHDFDTHNPQFERLIEMSQDRGSMEREEVGGNVYFGGTGSSVWSALQRGMKVGFVGGTDSHRAQPGEPGSPVGGLDPDEVTVGGLTAVLAEGLTREDVWEALYSRRCYATQGQRTLLRFELGEHPMGSVIEGDSTKALQERRAFKFRVVGHRPVVAVELVRNDGHVEDLLEACDLSPGLDLIEGEWEDAEALADLPRAGDAVFYYLRVTEADGRMAWSSPIWIVS